MKEYLEQKLEPRKNVFKKSPEDLLIKLTDAELGDSGVFDFEKKGCISILNTALIKTLILMCSGR